MNIQGFGGSAPHTHAHKVIQQTFAECLLGVGCWEDGAERAVPRSDAGGGDIKKVMRLWGQNPLGFIGHSVALGPSR